MELTEEETASCEALAKDLDPSGERGLEKIARKLEERIDVEVIHTNCPTTETAAREVIKAMREREGSEE